MATRIKIVLIVSIVVVALVSIGLGVGLTAAIWDSQSGGSSEYGPVVDTTDWNSWRKYFEFQDILDGSTVIGCEITSYTGTNLGDIYFPPTNNSGIPVTVIRNTVFQDATKKELPIVIYISGNVTSISAAAFAGLPNLEKVVFAAGAEVDCDAYTFAGCQYLTTVVIEGGRSVNFDATSFVGCVNLESITGVNDISIYQK